MYVYMKVPVVEASRAFIFCCVRWPDMDIPQKTVQSNNFVLFITVTIPQNLLRYALSRYNNHEVLYEAIYR